MNVPIRSENHPRPLTLIGKDVSAYATREINIAAGLNLKRGSVIVADGSGNGILMTASTDTILGILTLDIDTSSTGWNHIAPCTVYRRGVFIIDALIFGGSTTYNTTGVAGALRAAGIDGDPSVLAVDNFS